MSHSYHLRPNVKGRMQRRLDAHVAAFGEQNRDKIIALPSNTGQGVHLYFDPERSLSPDPDQATNRQRTDSTEGVIVIVEGRRRFLERERQKMLHQAKSEEERVAILRRDYEGKVEQFRRENADVFGFAVEGVSEHFDYSSPLSPEPFECGDLPPEVSHPMLPHSSGPSHFGQRSQEDRKQHQQDRTPLRRHGAQQFVVSPRDNATESLGADGQFVVVARRVRKLGPCGTVVIDHDTGDEKLVTKRYRVREEELRSIDGDGDSVMGSDD